MFKNLTMKVVVIRSDLLFGLMSSLRVSSNRLKISNDGSVSSRIWSAKLAMRSALVVLSRSL